MSDDAVDIILVILTVLLAIFAGTVGYILSDKLPSHRTSFQYEGSS
jgi:hypothetical protein